MTFIQPASVSFGAFIPPTALIESTSFSDRLTELLRLRGLDQSKLARALGISSQAVNQWASKRTAPSARRLAEIAQQLHVSVADLLAPAGAPLASQPLEVSPLRGEAPEPLYPNYAGYGRRLRAARVALGRGDIAQFARELGATEAEYTRWEDELAPPSIGALATLSRVHQVPADWVLTGNACGLPTSIRQRLIDGGAIAKAAGAAECALPDRTSLKD